MISLTTRPPRLSRGSRLYEQLMISLFGLCALVMPVLAWWIGWGALELAAVLLLSALLIAGVVLYRIPAELRITPTHLEFTKPFGNHWRISKSEVETISIVAGQTGSPATYLLRIRTVGRLRILPLFEWYRPGRDPESQGYPPPSEWRAARLRARAEMSAVVEALRESGYTVENWVFAPEPDNAIRSPATVAFIVTALAILAYAVYRIHEEPWAFLEMRPLWFVAICAVVAGGVSFAMSRNSRLRHDERVGVSIGFAMCIGLFAWSMAPALNAALGDAPSDRTFRLLRDQFVADEPGIPALPIARVEIDRYGWKDGDEVQIPVVRGALGAQYHLRSAHDRIIAGPCSRCRGEADRARRLDSTS